jgi:hypothetical protein
MPVMAELKETPVAPLEQPLIPVPPGPALSFETKAAAGDQHAAADDTSHSVNGLWGCLFRVCPKCGSTDVHTSLRHTFLEHYVLLPLMVTPYRCHRCNWRFRAFRWATRVPEAQRSAKTS